MKKILTCPEIQVCNLRCQDVLTSPTGAYNQFEGDPGDGLAPGRQMTDFFGHPVSVVYDEEDFYDE